VTSWPPYEKDARFTQVFKLIFDVPLLFRRKAKNSKGIIRV
jgi:hypothetical protein